ncbi:hypothetical protein LTR53_019545, partial [Teratosphaeriaceae sp. CCFEE 6253]
MVSKKQAEAVAFLTAAVHLGKTQPELLRGFENRLIRDKGKVLRRLAPIDLTVEYESLETMQAALLEARRAGLPDSQETLSAEEIVDAPGRRRSRKQLGPDEIILISRLLIDEQRVFNEDPELEGLRAMKA